MTKHSDFLIRYGIHHFVRYQTHEEGHRFAINRNAHQKMAAHARMLIQQNFGEQAFITVE